MPIQSSNLKAARIAETKTRADEAAEKLEAAKARLAAAKLAQANQGPNPAPAIDDAVRKAQQEVDAAEDILEFYQQQLSQLIGGEKSTWKGIAQYVIFGGLALIVLVLLMTGIFRNETLTLLSAVPTARGLITFLVAVVTVTIALILLLASIVSDSADLAQRFRNGKEVFVALVGVLGTIVGFYFGQTTDQTPELAIGPAYTTVVPTGAGNTIALTAFAHGGRPPYKYKIDFSPDSIPRIDEQAAPNGLISATVPTKTVGKVSYKISATDGSGKKTIFDSHEEKVDLDLKKNE